MPQVAAYRRDDCVGCFIARIVAGYDDVIRMSFGDSAHLRPFACIAIPAATEDAPQPAAAVRFERA